MDDDKSRGAFTEWLLTEKNERQSRMIDRVHGEEIIKYLRDERELGDDDPYMRSNYGSTFRHTVKQRGFKLHTVVGLGDILCLPMNQARPFSVKFAITVVVASLLKEVSITCEFSRENYTV